MFGVAVVGMSGSRAGVGGGLDRSLRGLRVALRDLGLVHDTTDVAGGDGVARVEGADAVDVDGLDGDELVPLLDLRLAQLVGGLGHDGFSSDQVVMVAGMVVRYVTVKI